MTRRLRQAAFVRAALRSAVGAPSRSVARAAGPVAFESAPTPPEPPDAAYAGDSLSRAEAEAARDDAVEPAALRETLDEARAAYAALREDGAVGPRHALALEAVQVFDGTRPAIVMQDGAVPLDAPGLGDWLEAVVVHGAGIERLAASVALIRLGGTPVGTGFLAAPGRLLTNRHVLEEIATPEPCGWRLAEDVTAVFAAGPSPVTGVAWAGPEPIGPRVRLDALDAAVLTVGGAPADAVAALDGGAAALRVGGPIHAIGYPLGWGDAEGLRGAQRLYRGKIGRLCWSPGEITLTPGESPGDAATRWALGHDASTLPGNSGSVLGDLRSDAQIAVGLHVGGETLAGNWAHSLSAAAEALRGAGLEFGP